ncbi:hypothetical protein [Micromonospora sp. NPDC048063]|uniref:hypothetical protein n=1 Tax=Micromonospora sp. NPDC048063 TaxID=3364256 RepID=UPI003712D04E
MRGMGRAVTIMVAAAMLAACGDGADGGARGGDPGGSSPSAGASPQPVVKAPEGFDTAKGWQETVGWLPEDAKNLTVGAAAKAGVVAFLQKKGAGYVVEARDAVTGAPRWSSQQWQPPALPEDVKPDPSYLPQLLVANEEGREYVVVWAYTPRFTEEDTVSLVAYPADSSGTEVAAAHTRTVPMDAYGPAKVVDGGNGLLVSWEEKGIDHAAAIDLSKDRVKTYDESVRLPYCEQTGCISGSVAGLSPDGPVVTLSPAGFGVPGVWQASDAVPPGADLKFVSKYENGRVFAVVGEHVFSLWNAEKGLTKQGGIPVAAVHDLKSGKLRTSVVCDPGGGLDGASYQPVLSPNGRYAVAGTIAVDFGKGKSYCFGGDGEQESVRLLSVDDDGTAYGYGQGGDADVPVTVAVGTGKIEELPQETQIPFLSLPGIGGFSLPAATNGERQFAFLPRR